MDKNGELVGIEFIQAKGHKAKGKVHMRVVYSGGIVNHTIPERVAQDFKRDIGKVREVMDGRRKFVTVSDWSGPR